MPDGHLALQFLPQRGLVVDVRHQPHSGVQADMLAIERGDARTFLPAMLKGIKAEIGHPRGLRMPRNTENSAHTIPFRREEGGKSPLKKGFFRPLQASPSAPPTFSLVSGQRPRRQADNALFPTAQGGGTALPVRPGIRRRVRPRQTRMRAAPKQAGLPPRRTPPHAPPPRKAKNSFSKETTTIRKTSVFGKMGNPLPSPSVEKRKGAHPPDGRSALFFPYSPL